MANDRLFEMLAQAESQPSKGLRAIQSAGQAGQGILDGYLQGKEVRQKLDQYRLLNSPLGTLYHDPSQIPFGLSPDHTVKDLLTVAPAVENYASPETLQQIFGNGNSSTGNNQPAPQQPATPAPMIASNPAQTPGPTALSSDQGTGAGAANLVPPGQPLVAPDGSPAPVNIKTGLPMKLVPLLMQKQNQDREGRQFQQEQRAEESRFERGQTQTRDLAQAGHMATAAGQIAPGVTEIGGIKNLIATIEPLVTQNHPIPGLGNIEAAVADKSGGMGTPQMKRSLSINNAGGALSAALDKVIAGRFNENEANLLKQTLVPNGNDQPAYALDKLQKLKGFVATLEQGNAQAISNMASAITGGRVNTISPAGTPPPNPSPGMVSFRDSEGGLHRIPSANLGKAKQRDPGLQVIGQ